MQRVPGAEDVRRVARLACLEVKEGEELERLTRDLARIVAHVEDMASLDLDGVEPTTAVAVSVGGALPGPPDREDVAHPSLAREDVLREAPRTESDGFAVPVFVGEG